MNVTMLKSKLHRAAVTNCNLHYEGSVAIDGALMKRVGLLPYEQVDIYNINNGERLTTYAIEAEHGSKIISIQGAAAHKASVGDRVIICSYAQYSEDEAKNHQPMKILLNDHNEIAKN